MNSFRNSVNNQSTFIRLTAPRDSRGAAHNVSAAHIPSSVSRGNGSDGILPYRHSPTYLLQEVLERSEIHDGEMRHEAKDIQANIFGAADVVQQRKWNLLNQGVSTSGTTWDESECASGGSEINGARPVQHEAQTLLSTTKCVRVFD